MMSGCLPVLLMNADSNKNKDKEVPLDKTAWNIPRDDSYLVFENEKDFKYYETEDEDGNYYEGSYVLYTGEDAYDYVTDDLESFGFTESDFNDMVDQYKEYDTEDFVCVILHYDACYIDNENVLDEPHDTPYFGWLTQDTDEPALTLVDFQWQQ